MLLLFFYYVYLYVWSAEMEIHICHNVSVERVSYLFSTSGPQESNCQI